MTFVATGNDSADSCTGHFQKEYPSVAFSLLRRPPFPNRLYVGISCDGGLNVGLIMNVMNNYVIIKECHELTKS